MAKQDVIAKEEVILRKVATKDRQITSARFVLFIPSKPTAFKSFIQ